MDGGSKMAKETMITYLDSYLNKKIPDYELALDWDTRNRSCLLYTSDAADE